MKPEARVFEITSPTKKMSLNKFSSNRFSQLKYYIWAWNVYELQKMCMTDLLTEEEEEKCVASAIPR